MAVVVSSRLGYLEANANHRIPEAEVKHEINHLKRLERVCGAVAIAFAIFAIIVLTGLIAGGNLVFGAAATISLVSGVYAYFCRQAQNSLKAKEIALQEIPK
jgi:hypothetical protein